MADVLNAVPAEVEDEIRWLITDVMRDFPIDDCIIEVKPDHDGDEAIFVDIHHARVDQPYDPLLETKLLSRISDKLCAIGERRYPYVTHHLRDGQRIAGWP